MVFCVNNVYSTLVGNSCFVHIEHNEMEDFSFKQIDGDAGLNLDLFVHSCLELNNSYHVVEMGQYNYDFQNKLEVETDLLLEDYAQFEMGYVNKTQVEFWKIADIDKGYFSTAHY